VLNPLRGFGVMGLPKGLERPELSSISDHDNCFQDLPIEEPKIKKMGLVDKLKGIFS